YYFVSRFYCPGEGVPEDPVTGSPDSMLIPYWSDKLGKTQMSARQVSLRGADPVCYTNLTLPTTGSLCRYGWSPYH
ncbi:PhzF family phenazine biosynthesis protein, partial [Enterobacter hormaechei]